MQRIASATLLEQTEIEVLLPFEGTLIELQSSEHVEARQLADDCLRALYAPPLPRGEAAEEGVGRHGGPLYHQTLEAFERHAASGIGLMRQLSRQLGETLAVSEAPPRPPRLERQRSRFECPSCHAALHARLVRTERETMVRCECGAIFAVTSPS